jgi:1-acyl-sn-glycerol-3-phosphate acyltransferase
VVPWALLMLLLSIFVRGTRLYWPTMRWLRMAVWGARVICGVRYRVHGLQHLPTAQQATQAVVLAAKHQSTWETFAFPTLMPHPLAYVFKRELLYIPFFGWAMGRLDMIHIDRSKRAEAWSKVAAQGKRLAAQGIWVILKAHASRVVRRAPTRVVLRGWPSPVACPSCPLHTTPRAAGRERASCCGRA